MRKIVYILISFLISVSGFSQCIDFDKLKAGSFHDSSFKNSEMAFKYFSKDIDTTQYCCDINLIKEHADFILEKSKNYITRRTNQEFYNKLAYRDLMVIYHDFKKLDNYYDVYLDLDKCGKITYWITYTYFFSNTIKYSFGLEFDRLGNLVSSEKFPDFNKNFEAENLIDICQALEVVKQDERFENKEIESIELNYLDETNSFVWLITEDKNKQLEKIDTSDHEFHGYEISKFYVNANTSIIEKISTQQGQIIYCTFKDIFSKN